MGGRDRFYPQFAVESQRSVENLTEIRLYPASEIILDEGRIQEGLKKIKKEAKTCVSRLREQFKTEEAARLSGHVKEFCEQMEELYDLSGAENYLHYFYDDCRLLPGLFFCERHGDFPG